MVTTTRGWWPALEPALLAFAVVVCGSVSLLAMSRAAASECRHDCETTRSSSWTTAAADQDPSQDALFAAALPPSTHWTAALHDAIDDGDDDGDDDDDGDAGGIAGAIAAPTTLQTDDDSRHPVIAARFGVALTLRSENLASRGPPSGRNQPVCQAHDFDSRPDSSDADVDDDDDDDDDDDAGEFDRCAVVDACEHSRILIFATVHDLFSLTSHGHSLRAPPQ